MDYEVVTLYVVVGALTMALLMCLARHRTAWLRSKSPGRKNEAEAERREMRDAAFRVTGEYWKMRAVAGARRVERLEKWITEHHTRKLTTGDIGLLPRNSCITQQMQSAIEGLDEIGHHVAILAIHEEERASLNLDIEELAAKLDKILHQLKVGGGEDPEDDFGAERGLEPGTGGTSSAPAADPLQRLDADAASPPLSNHGAPVRQPNRWKQTSRRRRPKDGRTER